MDVNTKQIKDYSEFKHSTLSKLAFASLVSLIVPLTLELTFLVRILPISIEQILFLNKLLICWIIAAPILSLKLSITDLKRQHRLRVLSKTTAIISGIIVGIGVLLVVISTISDLSRIF